MPQPAQHAFPQPFFQARFNSVAPGVPLAFDLYLFINGGHVLFRKRNDVVTAERIKHLKEHEVESFWVPEDQRAQYLAGLKAIIRNPDSSDEMKGRFIKESAFVHVHDLFTKQEIKPVISEAKSLVEEMVSFISSDVDAATSLMRLSIHDYYTYNHCVDVAVYSIVLARKVFADDSRLLLIAGLGGLLHDIGKRRVAPGIINKSTPLTSEEWAEIKRHPTYGKEFLEGIGAIPDHAKAVVFEHHENFDGTGYPQGLRGDEISKLARVVMIADVFDALTTDRSYHHAVSPSEALNTMFAMQPGKFDPNIFRAFNKNFEKRGPLSLPLDFDPCQPRPMCAEAKITGED